MPNQQFLELLPLWTLFLFSIAVFVLATEAGYRIGRARQSRSPDDSESGVSVLSGATLGLLAFLMAFVFSGAITISNTRRQLVVNEANAIGTAYLRAGYLPDPMGGEARDLLQEYVDVRLLALDPSQLEITIIRSEEIHTALWAGAETVAKEIPSPVTSLYIAAVNDVIDLHTERFTASLVVRTPISVIMILYLVGILTMGLVGIQASYTEGRNITAYMVLVFVLSLVFYLIWDLGRSGAGLIQVPQTALLDLQRQLSPGP